MHLLLPPSPTPQPARQQPFPFWPPPLPLLPPVSAARSHTLTSEDDQSMPRNVNALVILTWRSSRLVGKPLGGGESDKRCRLSLLLKLLCTCTGLSPTFTIITAAHRQPTPFYMYGEQPSDWSKPPWNLMICVFFIFKFVPNLFLCFLGGKYKRKKMPQGANENFNKLRGSPMLMGHWNYIWASTFLHFV